MAISPGKTMARRRAKSEHYVNNKEFLHALIKYKEAIAKLFYGEELVDENGKNVLQENHWFDDLLFYKIVDRKITPPIFTGKRVGKSITGSKLSGTYKRHTKLVQKKLIRQSSFENLDLNYQSEIERRTRHLNYSLRKWKLAAARILIYRNWSKKRLKKEISTYNYALKNIIIVAGQILFYYL